MNPSIVNKNKDKATIWEPIEPEENHFAYMASEKIKAMMGASSMNDLEFKSNVLFLLMQNQKLCFEKSQY